MTPRALAPRGLAPVLCLLVLLAHAPPVAGEIPPPPRWDHDDRMSSAEGYVQLRWVVEVEDDDAAFVYQLQEGRRPVFRDTDTRYDGPQHSSFVSGMQDGTNYFRVRARPIDDPEAWSEWSTTLEVEVKHHDRRFALGLMGLGAIVFLATAGFLISHRNDPSPTGRSS